MKTANRHAPLRAFLSGACICAALVLSAAPAASAQGTPQKGGRRGPPPEAFAACKNKSEKDACPITTPEGDSIEGTCMLTPKRDKLVCVPKDGPPPRQ